MVGTGRTSAQSLTDTTNTSLLEELKPQKKHIRQPTKKITKYTVKENDTLSKISKKYHIKWERIYYKNLNIKHPDTILVGQRIIIPRDSEKLKKRPIPTYAQKTDFKPLKVAQNVSSDNGYNYGYCTWYVKNRRPDIPNSWGNADTWDDYAPSSGYTVGDTPKVGAIGVTRAYMHVVYVERIEGDKVFVSEMNYAGWNVVSSRLAPITEFRYIY